VCGSQRRVQRWALILRVQRWALILPSPVTLFPSSQASEPLTTPSPQTDEQVVPLHRYPHSSIHVVEHPALPGASHSSLPARMLSPHVVVHTDGEYSHSVSAAPTVLPRHVHPSSRVQEAEQPSPFCLLPSSHASSVTQPFATSVLISPCDKILKFSTTHL
jgi:hypothetical protein